MTIEREELNKLVTEIVERCAEIIESVSQKRLPELLRGCGLLPEDEDGWADLSLTEQDLRNALANKLRRCCQVKDERLFDIEVRETPEAE